MIKVFLKDSSFYGGFLVLSKLIAIFTLPILTSFFPPKDFAIADSNLVFLNFVIPFIFLGLDSSVARFYNECKKVGNVGSLISSAFYPGLLASIIVTAVVFFFSNMINFFYLNQHDSSHYLRLSILNLPLLYVISFSSTIFKYAFRKWSYVFVVMLNPIIFSCLVIFWGNFNGLTLEIYFYLFLWCNLIFAVAALFFIKDFLSWSLPNMDFLRKLYQYGIPFFFVSLIGTSFSFTERIFINQFYPAALAGNYMFSYRIVNFLGILNRALQLSWGPFSMAYFDDKNAGKNFNRLLLFLAVLLNLISIIVVIFDKVLINILANSNYLESRIFFPYLLGANTFLILSSVSNVGINISKKTNIHLRNYVVSYVVFVIIFFFLKSNYLILSIPLAMLFSRMLLFINQSWSSNKISNSIQFNWKLPCVITATTTFLLVIFKAYVL